MSLKCVLPTFHCQKQLRTLGKIKGPQKDLVAAPVLHWAIQGKGVNFPVCSSSDKIIVSKNDCCQNLKAEFPTLLRTHTTGEDLKQTFPSGIRYGLKPSNSEL